MSVVTQGRRDYSNSKGNESARRFVDACRAIGYETRKSSREEDIYDHIDYWVKRRNHKNDVVESGVDVKGGNHPECVWVEFKNVLGDKGWMYGEAEFIAFDIPEIGGFAVVTRRDLADYAELVVEETFVEKKDAYRKLYQRAGRQDVISLLYLEDLKQIKSYKVLRYGRQFLS
jgi:hypothetical protein